jgi:hypothetical protein
MAKFFIGAEVLALVALFGYLVATRPKSFWTNIRGS